MPKWDASNTGSNVDYYATVPIPGLVLSKILFLPEKSTGFNMKKCVKCERVYI